MAAGGEPFPVLANVYLHWFEKAFARRDGPGTWANANLVRYAYDLCATIVKGRLQEFPWNAMLRER